MNRRDLFKTAIGAASAVVVPQQVKARRYFISQTIPFHTGRIKSFADGGMVGDKTLKDCKSKFPPNFSGDFKYPSGMNDPDAYYGA